MKKIYKRHEEKIRYLVVGGWNTLIGYLIFIFLYFHFHERFHYLIIVVMTDIISITNSYLCYKFFVFKTKGNYWKEYLRFYIVYGASSLVNIVLMPIFVEWIGLKPIPAQGVILFLRIIVGYFGHKHYSFGTSADNLKQAFSENEEKECRNGNKGNCA